MRILHLITKLGLGGAEAQLVELAVAMRKQGHEVRVVTLIPGGENAKRLRDAKIQLDDLGMHRGVPTLCAIFRLAQLLREWRPDVLQSWLYHADLLATIVTPFAKSTALVWNVRCSVLDPCDHSRFLFMIIRQLARWSKYPVAVVTNSSSGREFHDQIGYRPRRWHVIPNAIDTEKYRPSDSARDEVRAELGLRKDTLLIALVARFHPMKDHRSFLTAVKPIMDEYPDVHVALVGPGIELGNPELARLIVDADFQDRLHLLGSRIDMPRLQAAWDIAVSASYSEGFSNTIAEAMACGVPCVSTEAGDAALLLGNTGRLVPLRDSEAMGIAVRELLGLSIKERRALGVAARRRIEMEFGLSRVVEHYLQIYRDCCPC